MRAKLYPIKREKGSYPCKKTRCQVCQNVSQTDTFCSTKTGEYYKINLRLNCDDKCLVYLLTCRKCNLQYVGQTTEAFRLRWNNYRCNFRKFVKDQPCMQKPYL